MSQEPTEPPTGQEPNTPPAEPAGGEPKEPQSEPTGQEPKVFDEAYVKQLRKEAAEARTAKNKLEQQVQEYADRDKTEQEKLEERATTAESRASDLETKLTRFEVAAEKNLPGELVELLTGTKEEMEARADVLLQHIQQQPKTPDFNGGAREPVPDTQTPDQAHNDLILALTGHQKQT